MHINVKVAAPATLLFRTFSLIWWNNNAHTYLICHFNVNPTVDRQNGKTRKVKTKLPRKSLKCDATGGNNDGLKTGLPGGINTFVVPADSTGQNVGQLTGFSCEPLYLINPLGFGWSYNDPQITYK